MLRMRKFLLSLIPKAVYPAFVFCLVFPALALAVSQKEKLEILRSVMPPGESHLTPDLLLGITLQYSSQVSRIKNNLVMKDFSTLMEMTALDPKFSGSIGYDDDRNLSNGGPYSPTERQSKVMRLSAQKGFSTGTQLSTELELTSSELAYPPPASAAVPTVPADTSTSQSLANPLTGIRLQNPTTSQGFQPPTDLNETAVNFGVRQSLYKNAFGHAYQQRLEAAAKRGLILVSQSEAEFEDLMISTVDSYYDVWVKREKVRTAVELFKSQKRLYNMIGKQYKLGTSEKPDYLESKIRLSNAEFGVKDAKRSFFESWRQLIIALSLPRELLDLEPLRIPFKPDDFTSEAQAICRDHSLESIKKVDTKMVQMASRAKEAAGLSYEASKDGLKPDIYLALSSRSNSLEDSWGKSLGESAAFKNPKYLISLGFDMFLDNPRQKADALEKYQKLKNAEINLKDLRDQNQMQWLVLCDKLKVLVRNKRILGQNIRLLKESAELQEKRFRLGRISAMELYGASTNLTNASLNLAQVKASILQLSWRLRRLNGELDQHLAELMKMDFGK